MKGEDKIVFSASQDSVLKRSHLTRNFITPQRAFTYLVCIDLVGRHFTVLWLADIFLSDTRDLRDLY